MESDEIGYGKSTRRGRQRQRAGPYSRPPPAPRPAEEPELPRPLQELANQPPRPAKGGFLSSIASLITKVSSCSPLHCSPPLAAHCSHPRRPPQVPVLGSYFAAPADAEPPREPSGSSRPCRWPAAPN